MSRFVGGQSAEVSPVDLVRPAQSGRQAQSGLHVRSVRRSQLSLRISRTQLYRVSLVGRN